MRTSSATTSLGQPVKRLAGFDVQIKGRPLDFHAVTGHSEYTGTISLANDPNSERREHPRGDLRRHAAQRSVRHQWRVPAFEEEVGLHGRLS
jgi:hypothetical protein